MFDTAAIVESERHEWKDSTRFSYLWLGYRKVLRNLPGLARAFDIG
jgi:hypothetical protein